MSTEAGPRVDTTRASLLVRIRNRGDSAAWTTFDGIYRPMLLRFAMACGLSHVDAEDVTQQCMTAIQEHIGSFEYDPEKGRFKAWLRTIVNNKVRNLLRDRKDRQAESRQFKDLPTQEDSPEEMFEKLWMQEHLWHCLRELQKDVEDQTYKAFQHYVIDQWPIDQVCRELNMKANHVYTIKWRMTEKVSAKMKELLDGAE
ncbi:MAG: sigma-70 family RNA polymerase sigma factor [Phycisphaerales bacterium]|nr:sigma-70 family RNA polymerase sigma factor [Phycisphaerales bacterium]